MPKESVLERVESEISTDEVFFTLSNERRRHVLEYLRATEGSVTMRELVCAVAARERDVPESELTYSQRKSVYVSLHQTHLPKLDALGIVEYDSNAGVISLTSGITEFDFYYESVPDQGLAWSEFYLGLTGLLAAIVGSATVGIFPFSLLPSAALPWIVLAPVGIAAAIHVYDTRRRRIETDVPWLGDAIRTRTGDLRRNGD